MKRFLISIIGAIIFIAFILFISTKSNKDNSLSSDTPEQKLSYDWDELQEYAGKNIDSVIKMMGSPNDTGLVLITGEGSLGPQDMLHNFLHSYNDTIYFKELLWKQDNYDFYIWFQEKDSVWISVQGVKYDPDKVQF